MNRGREGNPEVFEAFRYGDRGNANKQMALHVQTLRTRSVEESKERREKRGRNSTIELASERPYEELLV